MLERVLVIEEVLMELDVRLDAELSQRRRSGL